MNKKTLIAACGSAILLAVTLVHVPAPIKGGSGVAEAAPADFKHLDANVRLTEVASRAPAFGGIHRDPGTGKLIVDITDLQKQNEVRRAVMEVFGLDDVTDPITFREAKYAMPQLQGWFNAVNNLVLGTEGLVFTDLDEANNRVVFGVKSDEVRDLITAKLGQLQIPADAIAFVNASDIIDAAGLQGKIRPLVGGIAATSGTECSVGFIADRSGVRGFVTASHCTKVTASYDGGTFYQPWNLTDVVGTEDRDPGTNTSPYDPPCPAGYTCRYTDSAFIKLSSGITATLGQIAKPDANLNIVGYYNVLDTYIPLAGESLGMVGAKSGYHSAQVTNTCITAQVDTVIYRCIDATTDAGIIGGDSGGAVFHVSNASTGDVMVSGVIKGSGTVNNQAASFYSPIGSITSTPELGFLTVH